MTRLVFWLLVIGQVVNSGRLTGVNLAVTITVPTTATTYDAGTATTIAVSGTAQSDRTVTVCTWTNSLGGSGTATGTSSWSISSVALTIGSNIVTVTCLNNEGTSSNDVITITRTTGVTLPDPTIPCIIRATPICTTTVAPSGMASAISSASNGATVCVTSGTTASAVTISGKNICVIGGVGGGTTTLTNSIPVDFSSTASRVSGFTMTTMDNYLQIVGGQGWRIDHNQLLHSSPCGGCFAFLIVGLASDPVEGLIDNNTIANGSVVQFGEDDSTGGRTRWNEALNMGTIHAVYAEDNLMRLDSPSGSQYLNAMDGRLGERVVGRFNDLVGQRFEVHSVQGDHSRAGRLWEFYNNSLTNNPANPNARTFFVRGGTGAIFHNKMDNLWLFGQAIQLDNVRSHECSAETDDCPGTPEPTNNQLPTWRMCGWSVGVDQPNGNSQVDGNVSGQHGWPCLDQIGRSTDSAFWGSGYPLPKPGTQASEPAVIWRNQDLTSGNEVSIDFNCENSGIPCSHQSTWHLIDGRDYYTYRSAFDGTLGIGEGTLASRPATCTTGVYYWATDQGNWNTSTSNARGVQANGADGVLYKCTSTNTWTLFYTPYFYPHPWQNR